MPAKKTTAKSAPKKTTKKPAAKKEAAPKAVKKTSKPSPVIEQESAPTVTPPKPRSKVVAKKTVELPTGEYFYANGKRKTAIARVRLYKSGSGKIVVNDRSFESYFPVLSDQDRVYAPLRITNSLAAFDISAYVQGGGIQAQAEAIRHGISKALVTFKPEFRSMLKQEMFLRRDSRIKERKKFGLKRARRAPQWSKR